MKVQTVMRVSIRFFILRNFQQVCFSVHVRIPKLGKYWISIMYFDIDRRFEPHRSMVSFSDF